MNLMMLWAFLACTPAPQVETEEQAGTLLCNGADLCAEPFNTATMLGTHNSAASTAYNFIAGVNANQSTTISKQLEDGIRLLMLDIYEEGGENLLCHEFCLLGSIPHLEVLQEIKTFLDENPREILSIIYQNQIGSDEIAQDLATADLSKWLFTYEGIWPTLGEMVTADQRLVVTVEVEGGDPPSIPNTWDLAWDTGYSWTDTDAFDCDLNRGELSNEIVLVNHWISTVVGTPDMASAITVNTESSILGQTDQCDRRPTWVAVDFYDQGDPFKAVTALNDG
jgi:hypothetical protein